MDVNVNVGNELSRIITWIYMSMDLLQIRVRADCKQNLLNTFMDERELIVAIPFVIFVAM
jgi:hypothetical protein